MIDLGGGCGGWIEYLQHRIPDRLSEVAIGDSSKVALMNAKKTLNNTDTYQVDLMSLEWQERWDIAFLLDVMSTVQMTERSSERLLKRLGRKESCLLQRLPWISSGLITMNTQSI